MRLAPDDLKRFLTTWPTDANHSKDITPGQVIALRAHLEDVCGSAANRHRFTLWIFGVESTNGLWASHWYQIRLWLDAKPIAGTEPVQWAVRAECYDDARDVLRMQAEVERQGKIDAGQLTLF